MPHSEMIKMSEESHSYQSTWSDVAFDSRQWLERTARTVEAMDWPPHPNPYEFGQGSTVIIDGKTYFFSVFVTLTAEEVEDGGSDQMAMGTPSEQGGRGSPGETLE
jgi:hypothetical protein